MEKPTVTKCDVFIVTCEMKHRKKLPCRIVMGAFLDEKIAKEQAEIMFQEKKNQFLSHIRNTSNFMPACLQEQENSWTVAYQPVGTWDMREHVKMHVESNHILTDMAGGTLC